MIMKSSSFIYTNPILLSLRFSPTESRAHFGRSCWSVHGSDRVCPGSAGSRSRQSDMVSGRPAFMLGSLRSASSSLRGQSAQALSLLRGARFIAWYQRHPFFGDVDESRDIFEPTKKALCHTRLVRWTYDKYDYFPALGWDTPQLDVLVSTRIWPGVSWFRK